MTLQEFSSGIMYAVTFMILGALAYTAYHICRLAYHFGKWAGARFRAHR